jgi:NADPH:quinone reductase-like Zn-dependent oxidoreductase
MKASYIISYGESDVIRYGDLPDVVQGKSELLIEVKAVSLNPLDFKLKHGIIKLLTGSKFPKILGSDFAGIVKNSSPDIPGYKPGDRVYGAVQLLFGKGGALAELLSADPKRVSHIPENMSFEEAASLPVAALTALNGLRNCGVTNGKSVLINGATGGVGHFAVQIAKAKGAYVTATCSQSNAALAKKLGADETIGYTREDLAKTDKKFDAILDAYGKMDYKDVRRLLKRGGTYASTLFFPTSHFASLIVRLVYNKKLTSSNMRALPEDYNEIEKLFAEKKLKPVIENIYTLEKAADAFDLAEKGKPKGKIIIRIQ